MAELTPEEQALEALAAAAEKLQENVAAFQAAWVAHLAAQAEQAAAVIALLTQIVEKQGQTPDPGNGGEDPPNGDPQPGDPGYIWDRGSPREEWPTYIGTLEVGYVRVTGVVALVIPQNPDGTGELVPAEVPEWGAEDNKPARRTMTKAGQVLMVRKVGKGSDYNKVEHMENNDVAELRCYPWEHDGGSRAFWVMHEQRIDGHVIAEHPLRNVPLWIKALDCDAFV